MRHRIRSLSRDLAIYGLGDVAVSVVNFLLLPVYVRYLTRDDYGVLALLGGVEVVAKIFFRCGLDGSFMRFYYDCEDQAGRQRLASTIFFFLLALNGALLVLSLALSPALAVYLFNGPRHVLALRLVLLNTFAIGFTFLPFHLLRMEKRTTEFSLLTLARSIFTFALRIVLIVGMGYGVLGAVLADLAVTAGVMLVLLPRFMPLIRPMFSRRVLAESLAFGLPRVPHAIAQQVVAVADRFILQMFRPLADVGVYSMGVTFGLIQKLFLSAFESAWAPFYYDNARGADAPRLFSTVTVYVMAVLALLTAGLAAVGGDLLVAMAGEEYAAGADVVAWTAVGVLLQFSQRFYPVPHDVGRLIRIVGAGAIACIAGRALPVMPPALGVIARGGTVLAVYSGLLLAAGVVHTQEIRRITALRRDVRPGPPVETTEFAGEIIAADVPATSLSSSRGRRDGDV
ncbi:MAG: oligosaccharide flippase family protein [Acidobacteria bacterium]|nr:oligosaccharide flippase family protein [Acidobacteriota bacterium]